MPTLVFIIPAYQPSAQLVVLVEQLRSLSKHPILVVNDGSKPGLNSIFDTLKKISGVTVLQHATNLGKGAALKFGFNDSLVRYPELIGVVTLDADGQHRPEDAIRVGESLMTESGSLVLGCRKFSLDQQVPLRSRFGNQLTRGIFKVLTGVPISDTQTGLRGIPKELMLHMLRVPSTGYDFETDMLMTAVRYGFNIRQIDIPTIYIDGNSSSHFNPLLDSFRIYFVFIRFIFASVATSILDFIVFAIAHVLTGNILTASLSGRLVAGTFNFAVSKRLVFLSRGSFLPELIRYASLVAFFLFISNAAIQVLVQSLGINVYFSKALVETSLFLLSFTAQRMIVFPTSVSSAKNTDWDAYYRKPFRASSLTRKITIGRILDCFHEFGNHLKTPSVVELGGGNSCIYGDLVDSLRPTHYTILDKNAIGLKKFFETYPHAQNVELLEGDILMLNQPTPKAEICFSIGLIEHFSEVGTAQAIRAHFECVEPNGLVLITFPTPTWLYRITRGLAEALNLWQFPDERPCSLDEVVNQVKNYGHVLHCSIIWPIFLTQGLIVAQRRDRE